MGQLDDLCQARFGELYGPLLHLSARSQAIFELLADTPADLHEIRNLMRSGWRENLVGAVAALFHPDRSACRDLLWEAFDRDSWVSPQLAVCALALGDLDQARKRLLLRCPTRTEHLVPMDPVQRGTDAIRDYNQKGMAALLATFARHEAGRAWLSAHLPLEDAFWALEVDPWDHGDAIARGWGDQARLILAEMGRPLPEWLQGDVPAHLLGLWDVSAVKVFCTGPWRARLYRLFHAPFARGQRNLMIDGGRLLAREVSGNQVLLDLPRPYLEGVWAQLTTSVNSRGVLDLSEYGPEPAAVQVLEGHALRLLESYEPEPDFQIVTQRLEECPASLWIVGIDSQASLDGGVSAAVAAAAGEGYSQSLREGLAQGGRQAGHVVVTRGFQAPVRAIAHVVTVPQPSVQELARALESILDYAREEHLERIALPALGCGAAGFAAGEVAGPLVEVLARHRKEFSVTLCAPREADRLAFARAARQSRLT